MERRRIVPITRRDLLRKGMLAGAALGASTLLGSLAGCAGGGQGTGSAGPAQAPAASGPAPSFKGPLHFFGWTAVVDTIKQRVNDFSQATGIQVEYTNTAWAQYRDTAVTKFTGNAPLDMIYSSDTWISEWAEAGWIVPIDDLPGVAEYKLDLVQSAIDAATYKGKFYGLPYYQDYMAFLYNEEILKKAGFDKPPATWDELTQQAKKIKADKILEYPVLFNLAQETWLTEYLYAMVYSRGGSFLDKENNPVFDKPDSPALDALKWLIDAVHTHKIMSTSAVETGELAGLKAMQSGQVAFTMLGRYRLAGLNDPKQSQIAGKARQAMFPKGMGGKGETVAWTRPYTISAAAAKDKARLNAAWKLMEWFGGKDNTGKYQTDKLVLLASGSSFAVKPLFQDSEVQAYYKSWGDPALMEQQFSLARTKEGLTPYFNEWNTFNNTAWGKAVLKQTSPEDALKSSANKWRELKKSWK